MTTTSKVRVTYGSPYQPNMQKASTYRTYDADGWHWGVIGQGAGEAPAPLAGNWTTVLSVLSGNRIIAAYPAHLVIRVELID